jgi:hypothetical protein
MITPTVGRVVWVRNRSGSIDLKQPEKADIVYVHSDICVNVAGYDANGTPFVLTSLTFDQGQSIDPTWPRAEWMPYQKGQAAKTEALEKQIGAGG